MNPVPYQQLFDIDGLKTAIRDCESTADEFSESLQDGFKRSAKTVETLRTAIEKLNATLSEKPIKLTDDAGQQQVQQFAKDIATLTTAYKAQQAAVESMNKVLADNKQIISDAKAQAALYATEQQRLKTESEASKLAIQQSNAALADNKNKISAANLANQDYIKTVNANKAAQSAVTLQIAQNRLALQQQAAATKAAAQAQNQANGSYNEANARLKALGIQIKAMPGEFDQQTAAGKRLVDEYNQLNTALKKFDEQMGNHQRSVGNYNKVWGGLQDELKGYATGVLTIAAAIEAVKKTFETALATDATRTALGYIFQSTELADDKLAALKKTANDLGLDFVTLSKSYELFIGAAQASNFDLTKADAIFHSVARAAAVLHLDSDKTTSALYALQEMMSRGTIQAKELQNQLGRALPGASAIMAQALGISNAQLHDMEKSGELIANDVLPKFAAQLDKTFAPGVEKVDSLQASVGRLNSAFAESIDEGTHLKSFFTTFISGITDAARTILGIVNSTSWQEFWARFALNGSQDLGDKIHNVQRMFTNSATALTSSQISYPSNTLGQTKSTEDIEKATKSVNELKIALMDAYNAKIALDKGVASGILKESPNGKPDELTNKNINRIISGLKSQIELYEAEFPEAFKTTSKALVELTDDQLTSIEQIRKRITELSKLPGSATIGSDINLRIDALKKRLHDLSPTIKATKDGFAILEEQIKKTLLQLQDSIVQDYQKHQGKETENTIKLANAYEMLLTKLAKLKQLQADAELNFTRQENIRKYGSVFPMSDNTKTNPELSKDEKNTFATSDETSAINANDIDLDKVVIKYADMNRAILNSYKNRNITKAQYDKDLEVNDYFQANEEYQLNLDNINRRLHIEELANHTDSKQYADLLKQKALLTKAYLEGNFKFLNDELEREKKKYEDAAKEIFDPLQKNASVVGSATNSGVGNLAGDLTSTLQKVSLAGGLGQDALTDSDKFTMASQIGIDSVKAYTDYALQASQQRTEALQREMQYEMDGAGTNAAARRAIEAQSTKLIQQEKTKQAKLQKAAAAIEIILNTAVAISKTLATTAIFGIPLIPVIAGLGAAELAIVLAQPIPQFAKGRESGVATLAEVNEKGPELIGRGNKFRIVNRGMRGFTSLAEGEKVITADKTNQMILNRQVEFAGQNAETVGKSKALYDTYIMGNSQAHIDYTAIGQQFDSSLSKLPFQVVNIDDRGINRYTQTKNARIREVRERNKM